MPTGIVEFLGTSGTGKPVVRISGQTYYPGKSTDISSLKPGMVIEMDTASSNFRGTTYWYLNAWKNVPRGTVVGAPVTQAIGTVVGAPQAQIPIHPHAQMPSPPIAAPAPSQELEVPQLTRDEQIFCQAILKSCIENGLIKEPAEMTPWVQAVRDICRFFA